MRNLSLFWEITDVNHWAPIFSEKSWVAEPSVAAIPNTPPSDCIKVETLGTSLSIIGYRARQQLTRLTPSRWQRQDSGPFGRALHRARPRWFPVHRP